MAGKFKDEMASGYALNEPSVVLGSPIDGSTILPDARVQVALSMMNRHGLIAGATGTGKTKALPAVAGQLSRGRALPGGRHQGRNRPRLRRS